jgi:hypothetical protein
MPHAYTEDQLVEQPAIGLFAEYSAGPNPHPPPFSHSANPHPSLSQWERSWEKGGWQAGLRVRSLVLVPRLPVALERLNAGRMGHQALSPDAIKRKDLS